MRGKIKLLLSALVILVICGLVTAGQAQTPTQQVNFDTGHVVRGVFLEQYTSVPNPLDIYGLPITDEFESLSAAGITTVQYFTKARFDLIKAPEGNRVSVAHLGELMYPGQGPLAPVPGDGPTCRRFAETGKSVCYAFLQYYDANKGTEHFGLPISHLEIREGRYVQYFEKVRMEWQPERDSDGHVVLTDLGKRYFDLVVGDPSKIIPMGSAAPGAPRYPKAHAFVARALATAHSQQTIFVVVYDIYRQPITNAEVWVSVVTPDGESNTFQGPATDENGVAVMSFQIGDLKPQQVVELLVRVEANGEEASATSWFRIWY
jgi:hypothetical protein